MQKTAGRARRLGCDEHRLPNPNRSARGPNAPINTTRRASCSPPPTLSIFSHPHSLPLPQGPSARPHNPIMIHKRIVSVPTFSPPRLYARPGLQPGHVSRRRGDASAGLSPRSPLRGTPGRYRVPYAVPALLRTHAVNVYVYMAFRQ
ncbi:hypothetical protein DENSPDRAFT_409196 [Dentipellis sp. KUC8613]|nr:hypothetical protein DENSPDRAFT_409196 [Dentipellis sp. KUC8613]